MPTPDRDVVILQYLADTGAMFTPAALYDNLKDRRNITFSKRTVKRRLYELADRGLVSRREVGQGYYEITPDGREWLAEQSSGE